jgi:hypothetical protein
MCDEGGVQGASVRCLKAPQPGGCGALVVGVPLVVGEVPVSGVGVFGDGGPGGLLVDDDLAGREGGDEGLDGEVVDGARVAARGGVDERDPPVMGSPY